MEIKQIKKTKNGKVVYIPKNSNLQVGDYIIITPFKDVKISEVKETA